MVGIRSFPFGARPIFRCELLVSGRVYPFTKEKQKEPGLWYRWWFHCDHLGCIKPLWWGWHDLGFVFFCRSTCMARVNIYSWQPTQNLVKCPLLRKRKYKPAFLGFHVCLLGVITVGVLMKCLCHQEDRFNRTGSDPPLIRTKKKTRSTQIFEGFTLAWNRRSTWSRIAKDYLYRGYNNLHRYLGAWKT